MKRNHPMTRRHPALHRLSPIVAAIILAACGSDHDPEATPTVTPTSEVNIRVVDGPIQNALVCLDANSNSLCDEGEIQGRSDAEGRVTLKVPSTELGRHIVLALVGTDAMDKDHGVVTTAFMMTAPPDATSVVSPLSTLVQIQAAQDQSSAAAAEQVLQQQLSINTSLLADLSQPATDQERLAADLARVLVLAKQQQIKDTEGVTDSSGKPLNASEIESEINKRLVDVLPQLMSAVLNPALRDAGTPEARRAAMRSAATEVAQAAGVGKANVINLLSQARAPAAPEETSTAAQASMSLRWFSFSDAGNYYYRSFESTAAQNTPDAQGMRRYTEYREKRSTVKGVQTEYLEWGINRLGKGNKSWTRERLYWTGTEWFDCPAEHVHEATIWNDKGLSESLYCKSIKSSNKRVARDIAGLTLAQVVSEIRGHPETDDSGSFASWGPDPQVHAAALGATFPPDSKLLIFDSRSTRNPEIYSGLDADLVYIYPQALREAQRASCDGWTASSDASLRAAATKLEDLVEAMPGTPCSYTVNSALHGDRNEAWGASTLSLGDISDKAFQAPSSYYRSGVRRLRVSFAPGGSSTYWSCPRRSSDGSSRNCDKIGSGSYSIEALGDARVLRLNQLPAQAAGLSYERLFVERGGKIYYGWREKLRNTRSLRLNTQATDALFQALQMP